MTQQTGISRNENQVEAASIYNLISGFARLEASVTERMDSFQRQLDSFGTARALQNETFRSDLKLIADKIETINTKSTQCEEGLKNTKEDVVALEIKVEKLYDQLNSKYNVTSILLFVISIVGFLLSVFLP